MSDFVVVLIIVLVLAAVGFGVWAYLRHRYVQSLRAKGWEFINSPPLSIVYGLNVPPFGMGFKRRVDDQVVGKAADGTPFSAFEYSSSEWRSSGYVVVMPLPQSLPPATVIYGSESRLPELGEATVQGALRASAPVPEHAKHLAGAAGPHLQGAFQVIIDHSHLVLVDAPRSADELEAAIGQLAAVRSALLTSPLAGVNGPAAPRALSFYGRSHWEYLPHDNSYLNAVQATGGGYDHGAHDIIVSTNFGLPFVRLRHTWKTQHTRRDSDGKTHTEIRNHSEILCEFSTTFPFGDISVNWGLFGRSQKFEWEEFNRRFTVRTADSKFGSAVMHQRQMEYLMQINAPKFQISGGNIRVGGGGDWLPANIDHASQFLHGFFGRVPNFVWQDLRAWPRPIAEIEAS